MGTFLSLSGVIGKTQNDVVNSLTNYARSIDDGLQQENINSENDNCCIIEEANGNTIIFYPNGYLEWEQVIRVYFERFKRTSYFMPYP